MNPPNGRTMSTEAVVCDFSGCCDTSPDHRRVVVYRSRTGTWGIRTEHHWLAKIGWVGSLSQQRYYGDDKEAALEAAERRDRVLHSALVGS